MDKKFDEERALFDADGIRALYEKMWQEARQARTLRDTKKAGMVALSDDEVRK